VEPWLGGGCLLDRERVDWGIRKGISLMRTLSDKEKRAIAVFLVIAAIAVILIVYGYLTGVWEAPNG
jgi:hypothetical protein